MLRRSSANLQKLLLRNYFGRSPRPKFPSSISNLLNQCSLYHNFEQPNHFHHPGSVSSATNFRNCRRFSVEIDTEVDKINLKFAEAREEIESAMESKETVYFNEEADCAREAVNEVLTMYQGLLEKLPEKEKAAIQRAMGLKIEQLKAEIQQLNE